MTYPKLNFELEEDFWYFFFYNLYNAKLSNLFMDILKKENFSQN